MPKKIFKKGKKYTFSDYFNMANPIEEIIAELGYSFSMQNIIFPRSENVDEKLIDDLRSSYYAVIPKVSVNSEIAKRELMIAPILYAVIKTVNAKLNIEYLIEIDEKLSGLIDYLFHSKQTFIVIEAKKGDLEKGFNQLAAEMIAIDKYDDNNFSNNIYGAISIGEVWRFAILDRKIKRLTKDIHTFRFPEDVKDIFSILKAVLDKES